MWEQTGTDPNHTQKVPVHSTVAFRTGHGLHSLVSVRVATPQPNSRLLIWGIKTQIHGIPIAKGLLLDQLGAQEEGKDSAINDN